MKKRAYTEPGDRYDKALDPASLPPCTPEIIRDGKPCILQKKPYPKIFFPGHKAPAKQTEEKPDSVEWGSEEKKPEQNPNKTEWGRDDE